MVYRKLRKVLKLERVKMTKVLSHQVSKCLSCQWTGDSWDRFCSVDKSHKTEQMFAYYEAGVGYTYDKSPSVV
jgi:hypothetical protein